MELRPVTVLIGPNGSGKSNFIEAFSFLHAINDGRLIEYVARAGGADSILHFGPDVTDAVAIEVRFRVGDLHENRYEIELGYARPNTLTPIEEAVHYWDKNRYERPLTEVLAPNGEEAGVSARPATGVHGYVVRYLNSCRVYHFDDAGSRSPMKRTADLYDNRFLRSDGSNLPAFLYLLREQHEDLYAQIVGTVQLVAPFFSEFDLEPDRLSRDKIRLQWEHVGSDAYWDAHSLSQGTLRFIALATLFLQPTEYRPSVIIVDEPELGLHPYAITLLASLIQQAAADTQVIVSTQSSLLVDHFEPQDVVVADRVGSNTRFTRLNSANLGTWLEHYSLGQLWEKNIVGGRPGGE